MSIVVDGLLPGPVCETTRDLQLEVFLMLNNRKYRCQWFNRTRGRDTLTDQDSRCPIARYHTGQGIYL